MPVLIAVAVLAAGALPGSGRTGVAQAQEPPPLRFRIQNSIPVTGPGQFDILQFYFEFAPGATIPLHRVLGPTIFMVTSGEVTYVEQDGEEKTYRAGQSYVETPSDHFDADVNKTNSTVRAVSVSLVKPGSGPILVHPDAPPPPRLPTFVQENRVSLGTQPAQFTLTAGIVDLPAGGIAELRTHPNVKHASQLDAASAVVVLITPTGVAAPAPTPAPAPAIRPPATGDAGLAGE